MALPAAAATKLTLTDARTLALQSHPQLQIARAQEEGAAQVPAEIRSRLWPQAFASTTGALAEDDNTRILAGGINNPLILNRWGVGVAISQLITDFGRTRHLAASAELKAKAAGSATRVSRADLLLRVDRAYYAALQAQAVLRVAQETVKARQLVADQAATFAANKLKSELDVSFARVNLQEARLLESNAISNARSSMVDLSTALGFAEVREFELSEESLPEPLPSDWESVAREALTNRPELQQARFDEQAAEEFTKAERALMFPTIAMVATTGVAPFHRDRLQGHWNAGGINVDLPFLNGGLFKARRTGAEARQREAQASSRDITNRVMRDVRLAYLDSAKAFERLRLTASLLDQAQLSLRLAQARYELGLSSIVELSQAQLNLTNAQIVNTGARYEYQSARAALEYEKGAN